MMISKQQTWLIVGSTRGIGLALTTHLLALKHRVIATARTPDTAANLWKLTGSENGANLTILECDVCDEQSCWRLKKEVEKVLVKWAARGEKVIIDVCAVVAGVLVYPNRISEISFTDFSHHLLSNTIGPLCCASALLSLSSKPPQSITTTKVPSPTTHILPVPGSQPASPLLSSSAENLRHPLPISTLAFLSSDSGSAARFRPFEDGFGAYAASKAALNQGLRHLAAELDRRYTGTAGLDEAATPVVLALHPGEVSTDMADVDLAWEVEGILSPEESARALITTVGIVGKGCIREAGGQGRGVATFWDWEGQTYPW